MGEIVVNTLVSVVSHIEKKKKKKKKKKEKEKEKKYLIYLSGP
jgi:hypothetical protein